MTNWLVSPSGAIMLTSIIAIGTGLALMRVIATQGLSARTATASLLILSAVLFLFGAVFFMGKTIWNWQIELIATHLAWERGFIIAAVVTTVL